MKHLDTAFVILHYLVSEQTKKCIDAITEKIDTQNYFIVIVDNFSNNGSIEEVENYINGNSKIKILKNSSNLGFANGNNTGIQYLNKNYDCDFICVLNNDVYLQSCNIYKVINKEFQISSFAVAGPKIYTKDGKDNSNPKRLEPFTKKSVVHRKIEIDIYYWLYTFHLSLLIRILDKRKKRQAVIQNLNISETELPQNHRIYNIQLHGCFYIFSKKYFEYYDGFDPRTFLYMEEEILYQRLLNQKLVSVYLPEIEVFHEEDASTNAMLKKRPRSRQLFVLRHHRKSIKILLDVIKEKE